MRNAKQEDAWEELRCKHLPTPLTDRDIFDHGWNAALAYSKAENAAHDAEIREQIIASVMGPVARTDG